jgi:hypothetical protein
MQLTLVAAMDAGAERIAARVAASCGERFPLFGPPAVAEFHTRLAVLRDELRSTGDEFQAVRMSVMACAWLPGAAGFEERLRQIEAALKEIFPGLASWSVAILLPPETASAEELAQTASLLDALEAALWETVTPDAVYLHQAPISLYRDPEADDAAVAVVVDALSMQFCETGIHQLTMAASRSVIDSRVQLETAKCCYSSAGRVRLFWPKRAVLEHLQARFERDVFVLGLLGEPPQEEEMEGVRSRAEEFFAPFGGEWAGRFPAGIAASTAALDRPLPEAQTGGALTGFERSVEQVLDRHVHLLDGCPTALDGPVREEVRRLLGTGEDGIRSARLFLDALEAATGGGAFDRFETTVFLAPMGNAAGQLFAARLPEVLSECGVGPAPARRDDEPTLSWLQRAMAATSEALLRSASPAGRLFVATYGAWTTFAGAPRRGSERAREALRAVLSAFFAGSSDCAGRIAAVDKALAQAAAELGRAPSRYGLVKRFLTERAKYSTEVHDLRQAMKDLARERGEILAQFERTRRFLEEVLTGLLLPGWLRARVCAQWWNHLQAVRSEFRGFVEKLDGTLRAAYEATAGPSGLREIAREDVANQARQQKLYDRITALESFRRHSAALLAMAPGSSYRQCLNLRDHYDAGAESLLRRMGDYGSTRVDAIRQYTVLDVLETLGEEDALKALTNWSRRAREFVDVAPASRQALMAAGGLTVLHFAWSAPAVVARLDERYQEAFRPSRVEMVSVDKPDGPDEIRIGAFLFGLPAEAVRRIAQIRAARPAAGTAT